MIDTTDAAGRRPDDVPSGDSSAEARLLVVDDDPDIRDLLADYLRQHAFQVDTAADGAEMLALLAESPSARPVDLVVLDIMMPGEDGLSLCRRLRAAPRPDGRPPVPIIFLTALGEATDRVVGLELGADDYVVKPFQPRELLARIRAVLRRALPAGEDHGGPAPMPAGALLFNGWRLDLTARHLVDPTGVVVNLSGAEYRLLKLFLEHPNEVLGRDFLQDAVQGRDAQRSAFDRSLDVQVCRLRARLKDNGREARLIKTVRGDGYVFTCAVTPESL